MSLRFLPWEPTPGSPESLASECQLLDYRGGQRKDHEDTFDFHLVLGNTGERRGIDPVQA